MLTTAGVLQQQVPPVGGEDARFLSGIAPHGNDAEYYGGVTRNISMTTQATAGRLVCGTAHWKMTNTSTDWAKVVEFSLGDRANDGVFYLAYHVTNNAWYIAMKTGTPTTIYSFEFPSTPASSTAYKLAFKLDLDNITSSQYLLNSTTPANFSGTALSDNLDWPNVVDVGVGTDSQGLSTWSNCAAGDGWAMISVDDSNNLDLTKVFDGSGYWTNPGKHFLNWYSSRPLLGMVSGPWVNQGRLWQLSNYNMYHNPLDPIDYLSTLETRNNKVHFNPGTSKDVNDGVVY